MVPRAEMIEAALRRILDPLDSEGVMGQGESSIPGVGRKGVVPAGVLVPVVKEDDGSVSVLFTLRTEMVKDHKGQVSFPGGVVEEGDGSYLETALRETEEEVGLDPGKVRVLGRLRAYDTVTGYRIHPFVGVLEGRPEVRVSDEEIQEIFYVGLRKLMDETTFKESKVEWEGKVYTVRAFEWGGPVIWGATANILNELLGRLRA